MAATVRPGRLSCAYGGEPTQFDGRRAKGREGDIILVGVATLVPVVEEEPSEVRRMECAAATPIDGVHPCTSLSSSDSNPSSPWSPSSLPSSYSAALSSSSSQIISKSSALSLLREEVLPLLMVASPSSSSRSKSSLPLSEPDSQSALALCDTRRAKEGK